MAALYLSGRQDPDGGASSEEELSGGTTLLEDSVSLELEFSSLELDSSTTDEELEMAELLDSGSMEELQSTGASDELSTTTSLEEELSAIGSEEVGSTEEELSSDALLFSTDELVDAVSLCDELLLPVFFHSGRPSVESHMALHFESARQESIMASRSD